MEGDPEPPHSTITCRGPFCSTQHVQLKETQQFCPVIPSRSGPRTCREALVIDLACAFLVSALCTGSALGEAQTIREAEIVDYQLKIAAPKSVALAEGGSTVMTPAQWVPERSDLPPLMLDGAWQVLRWPFPADEAKLAGPQPGDVSWQDVRQPGKVFYDDPEQPPSAIAHWNRVSMAHLNPEDGAIIRRSVSIPSAWKGKRILLRFEGIYPAGRIYWDGKVVGEQWSGLTRTEMDVTDWAATEKQHVVAVRLYRRHRSVQLDMPRHSLQFAGLNRSAFLHAVEAVHVSDFHLKPELAGDLETGSLRGFVSVRNSTRFEAPSQLRVRLEDSDGRRIADREYLISLPAGQERQIALDVPAGGVRPWNAECPHLYQVHLELVSPQQLAATDHPPHWFPPLHPGRRPPASQRQAGQVSRGQSSDLSSRGWHVYSGVLASGLPDDDEAGERQCHPHAFLWSARTCRSMRRVGNLPGARVADRLGAGVRA